MCPPHLPKRPSTPLNLGTVKTAVDAFRDEIESDYQKITQDLEVIEDQFPALMETGVLRQPEETEGETYGSSPVTNEETVLYQIDHVQNHVDALETHLSEGCRIFEKRCDCCLVPETDVLTPGGSARIGDSFQGKVYTHTGRPRWVSKHYRHPFDGQLQQLRVGYCNIPLRITSEHRAYAIQGVRRLQTLWRAKGIDERLLDWVPVAKLTTEDFIAFPIPVACSKPAIPDGIIATEELMEFCGLYLAQGSLNVHDKTRVTMCIGKHKHSLQARVKYLVKDVFGVDVSPYERPTVMHLCFSSQRAMALCEQLGRGALNKSIPSWALDLPENLRWALYRGLLAGDGHIAHRSIVYTTSSKNLAYTLRLLLFSLGLLHSFSCRPVKDSFYKGRVIRANGPRYDLVVAGDAARIVGGTLGLPYDGGVRTAGQHGWVGERYIFLPIKANQLVRYTGNVFNLAIEHDESYLTIHGALHNCTKHAGKLANFSSETIPIAARSGIDPTIFAEITEWAQRLQAIPLDSQDAVYLAESGQASVFAKRLRAMKSQLGGQDAQG